MIAERVASAGAGVLVLALSFALSNALARRRLLPDTPNMRSSHNQPTPRSGGMAISTAWALGALSWVALSPSAGPVVFPLLFIALPVFFVGLIDDKYSLPPRLKLAVQLLAALALIYFFGPLKSAPAPLVGLAPLGLSGVVLTTLWVAGFMNAYNFMDGVNGMAAACGGFILAAFSVAATATGTIGVAVPAGFLALALFGFFPVNFPAGRIFMGDNGSQAVGFLIAAFTVIAAKQTDGQLSVFFVPTAAAPFLVDVIFTVCHRALRSRNVLCAHCEHIYQLLVRQGGAHARVTTAYLAATALSTAAAFACLRLPAAWQFAPFVGLTIVFTGVALRVFVMATRAGLLEDETPKTEPAQVPELQVIRHAAE